MQHVAAMGDEPERDTKPPASKLGFDDTAMEVANEEPDDVGLDDTALVLAAGSIIAEPPKPPEPTTTTRRAGIHAAVPGPPNDDETT